LEALDTKQYKLIKIGIIFVTAVLFLAAVSIDITFAQNTSMGIPNVMKTPVYTKVANELGLPYNITVEDMKKPGYVDPIVSQANTWKATGMNDTQIVYEFAKMGVIYYPKTQDWAFGHNPTAEEQKYIPKTPVYNQTTGYNSLGLVGQTISSTITTSTIPPAIVSGMWTNYQYDGFDYYMAPGDLPVDINGTSLYYATTHIGCGSGGCFEIGVYRYDLTPTAFVVYTSSQNDDNGQLKLTSIRVDPTTFHEYSIIWNGVQDAYGYQYAASFDGQVIRTIHMSSLNCQLSQCLESWDNPGCSYTNNNGVETLFEDQTIYYNGGSTNWNSNIADPANTPRHDYPSQLYRDTFGGASWYNWMWVHY
jgi:hypothetical protein